MSPGSIRSTISKRQCEGDPRMDWKLVEITITRSFFRKPSKNLSYICLAIVLGSFLVTLEFSELE